MSEEWIEQVEEYGHVFIDTYLHPECDFIRLWDSREEYEKRTSRKEEIFPGHQ